MINPVSNYTDKSPLGKEYGASEVYDTQAKQFVKIVIKKTKSRQGLVYLNAILPSEEKETILGTATYTKFFRNASGVYGSRFYSPGPLLDNYGVYKNREKQVSKIFIERICSHKNSRFKMVGTRLMQAIFEISLADKNKSEGRIQFEAVLASHVFYRKLGFEAMTGLTIYPPDVAELELNPAQVDAAIQEKIDSGKIDKSDFGCVMMYLSKESIQKFKAKVADKSLLFKTQSSGY